MYVRRHKLKVYSYTFSAFLSDVGGFSGLFMGLSLWSLYTIVRNSVDKLLAAVDSRKKEKEKEAATSEPSETADA